MARAYKLFFVAMIAVIILDQAIKQVFLGGFDWGSKCISLTLTFNKGVAFSMFAFLGENLKFIQVMLITAIFAYILWDKEILKEYALALGLILGGGVSNLLDRFTQEGVVDYVYWHCGFDFAIFNFADVMINAGVALILLLTFKNRHKEKTKS